MTGRKLYINAWVAVLMDLLLMNFYLLFVEGDCSCCPVSPAEYVFGICEAITFMVWIIYAHTLTVQAHRRIQNKDSLKATVLLEAWIGFALFDVIQMASEQVQEWNKGDFVNITIGLLIGCYQYNKGLKKLTHS